MKKWIVLSSVILCSMSFIVALSQGTSKHGIIYKQLKIGDKLPDIYFKNIVNYPKKNVKVSDFKDKLIILDFWGTGCAICISSFPEMEELQKQFEGKLQVITVNPWETTEQIEKIFKERKKSLSSLPGVNGDTTWATLFPALTVPHHVWIDRTGTIIAITNGSYATAENVQAILDGKKVPMKLKDDIADEMAYKENLKLVRTKGWLQPTLPEIPIVYYAAFIPYSSDGHIPGVNLSNVIDSIKRIFRFGCKGTVIELFQTAFEYWKIGNRCLLEMKNKEQYQCCGDGNYWYKKYFFIYILQMPLADIATVQQTMRQDVNRFFGNMFGLKAKIEKRQWQGKEQDVLVITDKTTSP